MEFEAKTMSSTIFEKKKKSKPQPPPNLRCSCNVLMNDTHLTFLSKNPLLPSQKYQVFISKHLHFPKCNNKALTLRNKYIYLYSFSVCPTIYFTWALIYLCKQYCSLHSSHFPANSHQNKNNNFQVILSHHNGNSCNSRIELKSARDYYLSPRTSFKLVLNSY